jgi:hypothetical protein
LLFFYILGQARRWSRHLKSPVSMVPHVFRMGLRLEQSYMLHQQQRRPRQMVPTTSAASRRRILKSGHVQAPRLWQAEAAMQLQIVSLQLSLFRTDCWKSVILFFLCGSLNLPFGRATFLQVLRVTFLAESAALQVLTMYVKGMLRYLRKTVLPYHQTS